MLVLSNNLLSKQVLSIRTTTPIADVISPIINPNNLKIEGFYTRDRYSKKILILLAQDIREVIDNGYIVNDHEVLTHPEELVRLKNIMDINFSLINKKVETVSKQKVGKVADYATEIGSMFIQKIYVIKPIYKNLSNGSLVIDRGQINEITPQKIIINELLSPALANAGVTI